MASNSAILVCIISINQIIGKKHEAFSSVYSLCRQSQRLH